MAQFPIEDRITAIQSCLSAHRALILQAPPGAGKTTLVPLTLLDQPWLAGRTILVLEPRRLAARAAAARMAELLGEPLGRRVGYRIRFESKVSSATRIEVLTEGILTRRLQNDPELNGVGLVIFDEFHERSLHADLALALCLESQRALRDDLRLLIMSATLDGKAVAKLLGGAPIITSSGRSHPVAVHYLSRDPDGPVAATVARAVLDALREHDGDILAFLPGSAEIRHTLSRLEMEPGCAAVQIYPLYGDLPYADQRRALQPDPSGRRKIVLATAIAETSLTIEGIRVVIDSGWSRLSRFEPRSGLTRLDTVRVCADSAEQRAGRAGRLGPGVCYRLWSESTQQNLVAHRSPEILEADLAPLALELAHWGASSADLAWLDPPPKGALAQARDLLIELEALDEQCRITPSGRDLAALPLHPRLAHLVQRGATLGLAALACDLVAVLEERDILRTEARSDSDLATRIEAIRAFRRQGPQGARRYGADPPACARVEQISRQWRSRLQVSAQAAAKPVRAEDIGLLLSFAYPDRIARRRDGAKDRYRLASGRGARLHREDPLLGQDWLVAAHVDASGDEGRIFLAAPIELKALEKHLASRILTRSIIGWDHPQSAILSLQERRLGELMLASQPLENPDPARLRRAMIEGVRRMGIECLPWTAEIREWQARVLSLRAWYPEQAWPDLSDAALLAELDSWLEPFLDGITRREHLARLGLGHILNSRLDGLQRKRLEEAAPKHIQVPSGSKLRLRYIPGSSPVLAVKLQEMFGLGDTPRVAHGKVPVTLHLLSPAQRPIQITQDLRGFWEHTYAEIKKEFKGRYPKHPWPDDPRTAVPSRHTLRRIKAGD